MLEENGKGPTLLLIQQVAEKESQGMTPRSTPTTHLGPYSGSKSKPPPLPALPFAEPLRGVGDDRSIEFHTPHECPLRTFLSTDPPLYCEYI